MEGFEKGKSDEMVPMGMSEKQIDFTDLFLEKDRTDGADSRACVDQDPGSLVGDFKATGVAAVVFERLAADGARASGSPEFKVVLHLVRPRKDRLREKRMR
jgi:hypothetical protein